MFHIPAHKNVEHPPAQVAIPATRPTMDVFTATGIAEGFIQASNEDEYLAAWQHLIDTGTCWILQGWFGRQAREMIDAGLCRAAA